MSAPPTAWVAYDQFLNQLGKKTLDLNSDTFKVALFLSTSDCGSHGHSTGKYSDFTNEVSSANGYTTGGASAGAGTFVNAGGVQTLTVGNVSWTASGAGITARFAVLYDFTDSNKRAVAYSILDGTPADLVVASPTVLTIIMGAVGTLIAV